MEVCGELETSTDGTDGTLANSPHRKHGVVWGPSRVEVWRYPYEAGVASWAESLDTTRPCELVPRPPPDTNKRVATAQLDSTT